MKTITTLFSLFFFAACSAPEEDTVRDFIPGTYVRFFDHELRREYDTLRIEAISERGNNYRLLKSMSFQQKLDGQAMPWRRKEEEWAAIWDEKTKVLHETRKGKVISFAPEKGLLFVGTTQYKKIK
jgi:hypothetical protein